MIAGAACSIVFLISASALGFGGGAKKSERLLAAFGKTCSLQQGVSGDFAQAIEGLNTALAEIQKERSEAISDACSSALGALSLSTQDVQDLQAFQNTVVASELRSNSVQALKEHILALEADLLAVMNSKQQAEAELLSVSADAKAAVQQRISESQVLMDRYNTELSRARTDYSTRKVDALAVSGTLARERDIARSRALMRASLLSNGIRNAMDKCRGSRMRTLIRSVPSVMGLVGSATGMGDLTASGLMLAGNVVSDTVDAIANSDASEKEVISALDESARPEAIACTFERFSGIYCSNQTALYAKEQKLASQSCGQCLPDRIQKGFLLLGEENAQSIRDFVNEHVKRQRYGQDEFRPAYDRLQSLVAQVETAQEDLRAAREGRLPAQRDRLAGKASGKSLSPEETARFREFDIIDDAFSNVEVLRQRIGEFAAIFEKFETGRGQLASLPDPAARLAGYQRLHVAFIEDLYRAPYAPVRPAATPSPSGSPGLGMLQGGLPDLVEDFETVVSLHLRVEALEARRRLADLRKNGGHAAVENESRRLELLSEYSGEWAARNVQEWLGSALFQGNLEVQRKGRTNTLQANVANLKTVQTRVMETLHRVGGYLEDDILASLERLTALRADGNLGAAERANLDGSLDSLCLNSLALLRLPEEIAEICSKRPPPDSLFNRRKGLEWGARVCTGYRESLRGRAGY